MFRTLAMAALLFAAAAFDTPTDDRPHEPEALARTEVTASPHELLGTMDANLAREAGACTAGLPDDALPTPQADTHPQPYLVPQQVHRSASCYSWPAARMHDPLRGRSRRG